MPVSPSHACWSIGLAWWVKSDSCCSAGDAASDSSPCDISRRGLPGSALPGSTSRVSQYRLSLSGSQSRLSLLISQSRLGLSGSQSRLSLWGSQSQLNPSVSQSRLNLWSQSAARSLGLTDP